MEWDSNNVDAEEMYEDTPQDYTTFVRVNGAILPLEPGADFRNAIVNVAQQSKLGKFRLFLNGSEVFPEQGDLPSNIEEGMQFDMKPYDKAG